MRLIDADALRENIRKNYVICTVGHYFDDLFQDFYNAIDEQPTIDAEPVRHGKWITEECLPGVAVCSICGHEIRGIGCQYTKYCDECGARMDADALTKYDRKAIDEEIERAWDYAETD